MDQNARSSGVLNNQLKALSTTFRYALAGSILFTVPQMVKNLADFHQQLGLIQAIGSGPGGIPLVGDQFRGLAGDIQQAAVQSITPVNQFADALVNLYSTIGSRAPEDAVAMVKTIAESAQLAQVNITDATQAYLQMNFAFRKKQSQSNVEAQAREFFALIQAAPGGVAAGPQIIQQLGPLARVSAFAGMTQEQMMALTLQSLRGGGTPATNLRGLQFLVQSLVQPQTKEAADTLASIGITPQSIRTMPGAGFGALLKIIQHVRSLGVHGAGNAARVDPDELGIDPQNPAQASTALGISGAGAEFLAKSFHRIHALRTAVGLVVRGEPELRQSLDILDKAKRNELDDVGNMAKAWDRYQEQARLKDIPIALNALGLQTAEMFKPIIDIGAKGILGFQDIANKHPEEFQYGVLSALGLGGIVALMRKGGIGMAGKFFGRFGRGALGAQAVAGAIEGVPPKGTISDPIFVVPVVSSLTGGGGLAKRGAVSVLEKLGIRMGEGALGRFGLAAARIGGPLAIATTLLATPGSEEHTAKNYPLSDPNFRRRFPLFTRLAGQIGNAEFESGHPRQMRVAELYRSHEITKLQAENRLERIRRENQRQDVRIVITGADGNKPTVDVHVKADKGTNVEGKKSKKVSVPLELFPDFGPSKNRGKNRSSR